MDDRIAFDTVKVWGNSLVGKLMKRVEIYDRSSSKDADFLKSVIKELAHEEVRSLRMQLGLAKEKFISSNTAS